MDSGQLRAGAIRRHTRGTVHFARPTPSDAAPGHHGIRGRERVCVRATLHSRRASRRCFALRLSLPFSRSCGRFDGNRGEAKGEEDCEEGGEEERGRAVLQAAVARGQEAGGGQGEGGDTLMQSNKDRHEHELVVKAISESLREEGLQPQSPRRPQLARHGQLIHLHTPISADASGHQALALAAALHPTPAVAGLPRREAMHWLQTLEPFERGGYAAPIGWIDQAGDAELRVAIRCGHLRGNQLDLTAGAGLVQGSIAERELQEVSQKLAVLTNHKNYRTSTI